MMIKIKDCPGCHCPPKLHPVSFSEKAVTGFSFRCDMCGLTGAESYHAEIAKLKWNFICYVYDDETIISNAELGRWQLDAARYNYLRDGNAYEPEECNVRGGAALDDLCDAGIMSRNKPDTDSAEMDGLSYDELLTMLVDYGRKFAKEATRYKKQAEKVLARLK